MLTVALTGGIAAGKSIVGGILRRRGCTVDKSDDIARALLAPGQPAWTRIVERFGPGILAAGQAIDRKKLGALIFSDPETRRFVDGIVHPLVMAAKKETIGRLDREGRVRIFVSEAALTIEAGFSEFFDKIVVVCCPEEIQTERLMARDGLTREEAVRRIGSQMPGGEKMAYADYVVDTSGSLEETVDQAEELFEELLLDWRIKSGSAG